MSAPVCLLDVRSTDGEARFGGAMVPGIRDTGAAYELVTDGRVICRYGYASRDSNYAMRHVAREKAESFRTGYVAPQEGAH